MAGLCSGCFISRTQTRHCMLHDQVQRQEHDTSGVTCHLPKNWCKSSVLNLHLLCEFRAAGAHTAHLVTNPALVNLGTLWIYGSEKQVTAQALLCSKLPTPGLAWKDKLKTAPTDFYQHHSVSRAADAKPWDTNGSKDPDQLHLGAGEQCDKLSPEGEFVVDSLPLGSSWFLVHPDSRTEEEP